VLNAALACGSRLAQPGEFTKRAYLNGKLDLSQAEAVNDLIRSRTEGSRRSALNQLHGGLSRRLAQVDKHLLGLLAAIEASIDFPDDVDEPDPTWVREQIALCKSELDSLESTFRGGKILREGARVVICGSVNVGKSSLLNALLKRERAIVTPIPGTTRDLIEEGLEIKGIPITAIDTAGIRDTNDPVESAGLDMAINTISQADLVLLVMDASRMPVTADIEAVLRTEPDRCILVINKVDIACEGSAEACRKLVESQIGTRIPVITVSAAAETGIEDLESQIYNKLVAGLAIESVVVTNTRHHQAIIGSSAALARVQQGMDLEHPLDLLCIDIVDARRQIGLITGETVGEDVLESIFAQFCIGK
jgi:tRNA modification GTPase